MAVNKNVFGVRWRMAVLAGWLCGVTAVSAHDYWIRADRTFPDVGDEVVITIGGGHHFPESEVLIAGRMIIEKRINGNTFDPVEADNEWTTVWMVPSSGVFRASYRLKNPRRDDPFHESVTWIVAGAGGAYPQGTGQGLELIPLAPGSSLRTNGTLVVETHWNGQAVETQIGLSRPGARTTYRNSAPGRPAVFRAAPGPVLLTVRHQGRTATLTLTILPSEVESRQALPSSSSFM